jgi:(S)-citramalyl-CoA lyase
VTIGDGVAAALGYSRQGQGEGGRAAEEEGRMTDRTPAETLPAPRRSWLFVPATRPERFQRAADAGADVVLIDLEDAVAPADKAQARAAAIAHLAAVAQAGAAAGRPAWALRINGLATRDGLADLAALVAAGSRPDAIVLPKAESPDVLRLLAGHVGGAGRPQLVALIESAAGLGRVEAIARSTARLWGVMFGAADMSADLGCQLAWEPLAHARGRVVAAAAAAGITAIDSPFFAVQDLEGLAAETDRAVAMGFAAKAAIHPSHVEPINRALTPTAARVAWAERVLAANTAGIGVVDGKMIDEAIARQARRVLAAAAAGPAG